MNKKNRGDTNQIFIDANYGIRGYEPENESEKPELLNDPKIEAYLCRPQAASLELSMGFLDAAIIGEDWVREVGVNGQNSSVRRIGDLEYGQTKLIIGVPAESDYSSLSDLFRTFEKRTRPILCFTEYPYLTRDWVMNSEGYRELFGDQKPIVQIGNSIEGKNERVQIIKSEGVTEGYIAKSNDASEDGDGDIKFIVDNTQTGSTLKKYNLRILEPLKPILESSAGLYAGPKCVGWKEEKAQEIFRNLYGVVDGRKYSDVKFNVPVFQVSAVEEYLITEGLCADEPTIVVGKRFAQVNILIPKGRFPQILDTLTQKYNASGILSSDMKQYIK